MALYSRPTGLSAMFCVSSAVEASPSPPSPFTPFFPQFADSFSVYRLAAFVLDAGEMSIFRQDPHGSFRNGVSVSLISVVFSRFGAVRGEISGWISAMWVLSRLFFARVVVHLVRFRLFCAISGAISVRSRALLLSRAEFYKSPRIFEPSLGYFRPSSSSYLELFAQEKDLRAISVSE